MGRGMGGAKHQPRTRDVARYHHRVLSNGEVFRMNASMNASRLRQLTLDAVEHVPFYKQHWRSNGVDLTRVYSAVHLGFLPVVRKADLAPHAEEMRSD